MRSSTFDRAETSARVYGAAAGVAFASIGGVLAYLLGLRGPWLFAAAVLVGVGAGYPIFRLAIGIARGAGAAFLAFVQPSGKSSPYEREYSAGLALEASGDVDGAMAWFDEALVRSPSDTRLRIALADLCMRQGKHGRAEALYLEARKLAAQRDIELYCTQRIIDLRLGPLERVEEAFPELRRVMDRFPGTRVAEGAGRALSRLKVEQSSRS